MFLCLSANYTAKHPVGVIILKTPSLAASRCKPSEPSLYFLLFALGRQVISPTSPQINRIVVFQRILLHYINYELLSAATKTTLSLKLSGNSCKKKVLETYCVVNISSKHEFLPLCDAVLQSRHKAFKRKDIKYGN